MGVVIQNCRDKDPLRNSRTWKLLVKLHLLLLLSTEKLGLISAG